ncbi:hypothetical protein J7J83_03650 [bacterium]|nr:hypothetical protein [bacterium]
MKRFLANWELKVLAVLSAIILWFFVVGTENMFYVFPQKIPVKAFNLADNLVVSNKLPEVSLRLKIDNRESVKNLTSDDFSAFVDLEGQKEGNVSVEVEVSSKSSDVAVVKVEPSQIDINIEKISEKEVPLDYKINGDVAEGFQVGEVRLSEENITVKGSQNVLDSIDKATLPINLDNNRDDLHTSVSPVVYDSNGEIMNNISFNKESIDVDVIISLLKDQKILGVQPKLVGNPDDSVLIKSVNVDPSYIVATGDKQALKDLEFAITQDINLNGLKEDKVFTVSIVDLPEGVKVEDDSIKVSITVKNYNSDSTVNRKTVNVPLLIKKFKSVQRGSKLDPPSITLTLEGSKEALAKVEDSLKINLDISGVSKSGGTVNLNSYDLGLPSGVSVVSISPKVVTVTWK